MTAYIITAVHNRYEITKRFVTLLKKQTYQSIHLVLVDDGSDDGTDVMVKAEYPDSTILYGNGQLWWGGALHMAYKYLVEQKLHDEDVIFFINDDSCLGDDFIQRAIEILEENRECLLTGCGYSVNTGRYLDGPIEFNLKNGAVRLLDEGESGNCASTRALCLRYKLYRTLGGFHPILLPHYASDYEYTIRAAKRGHRIISDSRLRYEFHDETTGDNSHDIITLKKLFGKRSKLNLIYKLSFILMIAPIYRLPSYINYQIKNFMRNKSESFSE